MENTLDPEKIDDVPVKSTQLTFRVIQALMELEGAGPSEVAKHLAIPKSTAHDHLRTLTQIGYIKKNGENYEPGMRLLELGGYTRSNNDLFRVAKSEIDELANEVGQHANLMVEENGWGYFLYIAKGEDAVWLDTYIGKRVPLQTTSMGKSILAFFDRDKAEEIIDRRGLPKFTPNTVTDKEELFEELKEIRERGFALDDEERVEGMRCVGTPIKNREGEIMGAVSVSGPTSTFQGDYFENELPHLVQNAANVIEVNVTHSPKF